jgi:DNA-binding transcriptional ArsR family regulator
MYSYERKDPFIGCLFQEEIQQSCRYRFENRENAPSKLLDQITEDELLDMAELFRLFGDSTRIKILYDLTCGEKSVTEICDDLEMNQSAISHQLKILRTSKLIKGRREGKIHPLFAGGRSRHDHYRDGQRARRRAISCFSLH